MKKIKRVKWDVRPAGRGIQVLYSKTPRKVDYVEEFGGLRYLQTPGVECEVDRGRVSFQIEHWSPEKVEALLTLVCPAEYRKANYGRAKLFKRELNAIAEKWDNRITWWGALS